MRMQWQLDLIQDEKTTEQTVRIILTCGNMTHCIMMDPRDAEKFGTQVVEGACMAKCGVIKPTDSLIKMVSN